MIFTILSFNAESIPVSLPSFTSSVTLEAPRPEPEWITPKETVRKLAENGVRITSPTLFNMEKRKELHPQRLSARKILFDWNEVKDHFNIENPSMP